MGARVSRTDHEWVYTDEPHATRRKLILAKYPQIKKLMVVDPNFKWIVIGLVLTQFVSFYLLQNVHSFWLLLTIGYCFGGVINKSLMMAIHDITHNQAFGQSRTLANSLFGIFANLPIGIPYSVSFKKYHSDHHRYLGYDELDTDIPTRFEAKLFTTTSTKILWIILLPFFYTLRPLIVNPKEVTKLELLGTIIQLSFNTLIVVWFGWHVLAYMVASSVLSMGLHPLSGHFISEHFIIFQNNKTLVHSNQPTSVYANDSDFLIPETFSYYGPLNRIMFNFGYHVEHHDFPSIPSTLLPMVRKIAPEFYEPLLHHTSLIKVLLKYITDPSVGPFARVKRPNR